MSPPTHYEALGLPANSSSTEIARRADELLRLYGSDAAQSGMTRLIEEAKRVLTNPTLRTIYDEGLVIPPPPTPSLTSEAHESTIANPVLSVAAVDERTAAFPMPADRERTVSFPGPEDPSAMPDDRKIALELERKGVSKAEVEQFLAMNRPVAAQKGKTGKPIPVDLSTIIPPSKPYVPKPTIALPAFRESTVLERMDADKLLTSVNISRRRGQFAQAETDCRAALMLIPKDGAALEMYGDILQSVGRVDDALYAYERALQADPKRTLSEKKYAELMLLQNREIEMLRVEYVPKNPTVAVLLSSLFSGSGQIYNGDTLKGIVLITIFVGCIFAVGKTTQGGQHGHYSMNGPMVVIAVLGVSAYIFGVVDALQCAKRGRKLASGWDI